MNREQERAKRKLEKTPVVECNKIQNKYYPELFAKFAEVDDPRNQSYIEYPVRGMLGTTYYKCIGGISSMQEMTRKFNDDAVVENLYSFMSEEKKEYLPHGVTENEFLARLNPEELEKIQKDIAYALTVEAVMKWYANELGYGEDAEYWRIVGLLHDIDFELYPEEHCLKAPEMLREAGVGEDVIHSVVSHGYGITVDCGVTIDVAPEQEMKKVFFAADELTGLIWAAAWLGTGKNADHDTGGDGSQ